MSIDIFSSSVNSLPLVEPFNFNWRQGLGIGEEPDERGWLLMLDKFDNALEGPAENPESKLSSISNVGLRYTGYIRFRCS